MNNQVINFCVDEWQPPPGDGVLLLDSLFWSLRLAHVEGLEDSDDDDWSHVLSDPVLRVSLFIFTSQAIGPHTPY